MARNDLVASLRRGIDILKFIGSSPNGATIRETALAMALKPSTCYNLVRTLVQSGFARRHNGRIVLGEELVSLTRVHLENLFYEDVEQVMLKLFQNLPRSTVIFAVNGGAGPVQTHRISFERPGVVQHLNSEPMHLYATAAGLVSLAYTTGIENKLRLQERWPFAEFGAHLWKSHEELERYLIQVRRQEYAFSPFDQDVFYRISAPVFNREQQFAAIIGISIPVEYLNGLTTENLFSEVRLAAEQLSLPR